MILLTKMPDILQNKWTIFINIFQDKLKVLAYYVLIWLVIFILMYHFMPYKQTPNASNIVSWDAGWFKKVKENGYIYYENQQSNPPFFPAFPYVWRVLEKIFSIDNLEISIVNFIFFWIGFLILSHAYQIHSLTESLLILSAPCLFFVYVPYSEALFFLFSAFIIYGLKKEKIWITCIGLFLASLTRSVFIFILPCIIVTEMIYFQPVIKKIKNILLYSLTLFSGIFTVVWIQWSATGVWFAFIKAHKHWGHQSTIGLPKIPFQTWDIKEMMFIDLLSIWLGLLSVAILIAIFYHNFMDKKAQKTESKNSFFFTIDKPLLFSLSYLAIIAGFTLFVQREYLTSASRYVFASIFYSVFILSAYRNYQFSKLSAITFMLLYMGLFYLALPTNTGDNQTMQLRMLFSLLMIVLWILYAFLFHWQNRKYFIYLFIFMGMCIQVFLFERFISGMWAG